MRRRAFLVGIGVGLGWPLVARAQQQAMPVIGFLGSETPEQWKERIEAFRAGIAETGFIEGRTIAIEYLWAEGRNNRLAAMAEEFVRRNVSLIAVLGSTASAVAAKNATSSIPIVVRVAVDPSTIGLVSSMSRPGGNLTGWTTLGAQIGPKQLELMREILPQGSVVGVLTNPTNPLLADRLVVEVPEAARRVGFQPHVVRASTDADLDAAFAALGAMGARGLVIGADTFFNSRNDRLAQLAQRHRLVAVSAYREFATAGGLMSYGGSVKEASRQVGIYAGRLLKGERPGDLPIQQVSKLDLTVNMKSASEIGVNIPVALLARAEEVIE